MFIKDVPPFLAIFDLPTRGPPLTRIPLPGFLAYVCTMEIFALVEDPIQSHCREFCIMWFVSSYYTKSLVNTNLFYTNFKHALSKSSHSSLNTYYETEIPSLTRISLHVVLTNLVNMNFASHNFFPEPKVALTKELVWLYTKSNPEFGTFLCLI